MTSQVCTCSHLQASNSEVLFCLKMPSSSAGDGGKRKREPGKRCVVIYCNNTNDSGVSLHQFPTDEKIRQKWIEFVVRKRDPKSWTPGSGHICSDHFEKNDFENYYAKMSGLCSKLLLRKEAVPSIQPTRPDTSTDSLQQQPEIDFRKKKCRSTSPKTATTQSSRRKSNALTKLRAHRVSSDTSLVMVMVFWFVCNFQRKNFGQSCYSNTILIYFSLSRYKQHCRLSMKTLHLRGSSKRTRAQTAAHQYMLLRKYRMFAQRLLRRVIRDLQGEVKVISLQCLILNSCARQDE